MGLTALRAQARKMFEAGVAAADPFQAVVKALDERPMQATEDGGKNVCFGRRKGCDADGGGGC